MMRRTSILILFSFGFSQLLSVNPAGAAFLPGGQDFTPTTYEVTITRVAFVKSDGTEIVLTEGSFTFDIASANAGSALGTVGANAILTPGIYTSMKFRISRTFGITGTAENFIGAQEACTGTGNGNIAGGGVSNLGVATIDPGCVASKQTILVPDGGAADTAISNAGITEIGSTELEVSTPVSFTIDPTDFTMPNISVDFDVTNSCEFADLGSDGETGDEVVIPGPPTMTISVG